MHTRRAVAYAGAGATALAITLHRPADGSASFFDVLLSLPRGLQGTALRLMRGVREPTPAMITDVIDK
eukprot:4279542-Pleurochrysis_carterae.AAC.2